MTEIGHELIAYFNAERDRYIGPPLRQTFPTDLEVTPLQQIMAAIQRAFRVQEIIQGFILIFLIIGFVHYRGAFWRRLAKAVVEGSVFTILLLLLMGGSVIFAFDWFWWEFHEVVWPDRYWHELGIPEDFVEHFRLRQGDFLEISFESVVNYGEEKAI